MDITGSEEEENSMPISTSSLAAMSDSSRLRMLTTSALAAAAQEDEDEEEEEEEEEQDKQQRRKEKKVRYRECQKNHAANLGGQVTDGCGEFMPSGTEGTPEALRCAACECHRNFHRREVEGERDCDCYLRRPSTAAAVSAPNLLTLPFPGGGGALPRPRMMVGMGGGGVFHKGPGSGAAVDDEREGRFLSSLAEGHGHGSVRKRFRTKFTHEQKERMLAFAQRLGWRIQKQDEVAVQNFCQEVGVKRHVLKVWMHNNKHNFAASKSLEDNITAPVAAAATNNNNSTSTTTITTTTNTNTNTSHNGINNLFN